MVGVTILLSKSQLQKNYNIKEKIIKIKPIEIIKKENSNTLLIEDEGIILERDLNIKRAELASLKHQKEIMLKKTIEDVKQEKEKWVNEKKILMEQAHEEGYQAGLAIGEKEGLDQYSELLVAANKITDAATIDYHETLEQSDEIIVSLAIHTAEKIIKKEIAQNSDSFLPIVRAAINDIKDQSIISIYLHPVNYEYVLQQKNELMNSVDGDTKISIYIDQKIAENSCLIEHPFGQIDASLDTQLQEIHNILQEVVMENKQ